MSWVIPDSKGQNLYIVYGVETYHEVDCESYTDDGCECYKKYNISPEIKNTYHIKNYFGNAFQSHESLVIGTELMRDKLEGDLKVNNISHCMNKLPPSSIEKLDNEFMRIFGEKGSYLLIFQSQKIFTPPKSNKPCCHDDCIICGGSVDTESMWYRLPCKHEFHVCCIDGFGIDQCPKCNTIANPLIRIWRDFVDSDASSCEDAIIKRYI